jgi:hypothetical protein
MLKSPKDMTVDEMKDFIDKRLSGALVGPKPAYLEPLEYYLIRKARDWRTLRPAYQSLLEERITGLEPRGVPALLRIVRQLHDTDASDMVFRWAYPDSISREFLSVHAKPYIPGSIGEETVRLFDATQDTTGFYAQLMEETPAVEVFKECMRPLARRDLDLFNAALETRHRFDQKAERAIRSYATRIKNQLER